MTGGNLYISWFLEKLPSLEELYIKARDCVVKGNVYGKASKNEAHLKLRYLKITSDIQQEGITLLKKVAPNLKCLQLELCGLEKRNSRMIDLTDWELDKCSIYFDHLSSKSNHIICIVTIANVTRRLVFEYQNHFYLLLPEHYKPVGLNDVPKHAPILNLSCETIQHLKAQDYMITPFGK
jgi:hypothetical protein